MGWVRQHVGPPPLRLPLLLPVQPAAKGTDITERKNGFRFQPSGFPIQFHRTHEYMGLALALQQHWRVLLNDVQHGGQNAEVLVSCLMRHAVETRARLLCAHASACSTRRAGTVCCVQGPLIVWQHTQHHLNTSPQPLDSMLTARNE
jgi:hypothetical protein